jgi:hypothetical protein
MSGFLKTLPELSKTCSGIVNSKVATLTFMRPTFYQIFFVVLMQKLRVYGNLYRQALHQSSLLIIDLNKKYFRYEKHTLICLPIFQRFRYGTGAGQKQFGKCCNYIQQE